ncbi:MAG: histidine phosphatase family protein [Acidimicrobiales bacterium]
MTMLRFITHPNVEIDPLVPVPRWSLNEQGRRKAEAMLRQPWVDAIGRVVSSDETKALETAQVLADHLQLSVEVRPDLAEIDRSSTGFIPTEQHERLADLLFAKPDRSADGWERAVDAQRRVVDAVSDLLSERGADAGSGSGSGSTDLAVVGHGAVGTLLFCHLAGLAIDRNHDQPGQGHYWTYDRGTRSVTHPWRPIEDLEPGGDHRYQPS